MDVTNFEQQLNVCTSHLIVEIAHTNRLERIIAEREAEIKRLNAEVARLVEHIDFTT